MSRRKTLESAGRPAKPSAKPQTAEAPPALARWPQPTRRRGLVVLAAICLASWLLFLAYLAVREAS